MGRMSRRQFLRTATVAAASVPAAYGIYRLYRPAPPRVAILDVPSYSSEIAQELRKAFLQFPNTSVRGKKVLLKPNMVEFSRVRPVNTHPAVVRAAIELFLSEGAREVVVAEGPGHRRDAQALAVESGLWEALRGEKVRFIDLNHDDIVRRPVRFNITGLGHLYFPKSVLEADLVVSMPKLKTHHWMGATLSLKNLFGTLPGVKYGWPKNLLHWCGIANSILEIATTLRPGFAIVDGIVGMEGDGPIKGTERKAGVVVMGENLAAVDATCVRLMGMEPLDIPYLELAWRGGLERAIGASEIRQIGETLQGHIVPFQPAPYFHETFTGTRAEQAY